MDTRLRASPVYLFPVFAGGCAVWAHRCGVMRWWAGDLAGRLGRVEPDCPASAGHDGLYDAASARTCQRQQWTNSGPSSWN